MDRNEAQVERIRRLEHLVRELQQVVYGKRSEKLTPDERQLAFENLAAATEEVEAAIVPESTLCPCGCGEMMRIGEMIPGSFGRPGLHMPENIARAARLGAKAGADAVKTAYTGFAETFRKMIQACYCPAAVQGGARQGCDAEVLSTVRGAVQAGAAVGRNLWQHDNPAEFATALSAAIHDGALIGEAPGIPGCVRPATGGDGEDRRG